MTTDQGELFPEAQHPRTPPPDGGAADTDIAPVWLQRVSLVVLVIFCFYIGGLLVLLPWNTHWWERNGWLMAHPVVDSLAQRGWVRGMVSGVGLIDIWIGISEMIHYRDYRA